MANKTKTREITIVDKKGTFETLFQKFSGEKKGFDFEGISALRKLLSNEKARILYTIKQNNPRSIYFLAKILNRDYKSVFEDLKLLERFGFIDMISEKKGKRNSHKPVLVVDSIYIHLKL